MKMTSLWEKKTRKSVGKQLILLVYWFAFHLRTLPWHTWMSSIGHSIKQKMTNVLQDWTVRLLFSLKNTIRLKAAFTPNQFESEITLKENMLSTLPSTSRSECVSPWNTFPKRNHFCILLCFVWLDPKTLTHLLRLRVNWTKNWNSLIGRVGD